MKRREETFCSWLGTVSLKTLLLVCVPCLLVLPLVLYWVLTTNSLGTRGSIDSADTARRVLGLIDFDRGVRHT